MSRRTEKVESLLQQEVGDQLSLLELPTLTTISKVEVTPDLKWCKIWITVMGDEASQKAVLEILHDNKAEMQAELNQKLTMKFVPKIKFVLDYAEEYADRINELIRKTHEEE